MKLEPCPSPWCAKEEPDVEVTGYRGMEFVVCGNCGCTGPEGSSPAEAITAWNTRTTASAGQVEALAHELREQSRYPSGMPRISLVTARSICRAALSQPPERDALVEAGNALLSSQQELLAPLAMAQKEIEAQEGFTVDAAAKDAFARAEAVAEAWRAALKEATQ